MIIRKIEINGSSSIGLFFHLFEDFAICKKGIKIDIDLPVYYVDSPIITPYFAEYEDKIVLSKDSPKDLKEILNKHFDIVELETKTNLIGNIYLFGKEYFIYSYSIKKDNEIIENKLGIKGIKVKIKYPIGSISKIYNNRLLIGSIVSENTINKIKKYLTNIEKISTATVNFGSYFLRYGIEINKDYLFVGKNSTGNEILNIEDFFFS